MSGFQQYIDTTRRKINIEKEIYLTGEFNIIRNFTIQLPAGFSLKLSNLRVTEYSTAVIDNIYTNTFSNAMVSGNILLCPLIGGIFFRFQKFQKTVFL